MQLELDRVVFVPVGRRRTASSRRDPGAEARLEMVELAVGGRRALHQRRGSSSTARARPTRRTRCEQLASESPDDELFLILGGDQAASLATWHEPEKVLERATRGRVRAHELEPERDRDQDRRACPARERVRYLDMPLIQVSSSAIRRRVREGAPIRYLVPDKVAEYITSERAVRRRAHRGAGHLVTAVEATPDSAELAERIAAIASDKKAIDIRVIDLRGIVSYTDFFVICSGNTERQAKAIHDAIYEELKKGGDERLLPRRTEGAREARWILLDYWDVVVHIFTPEAREYYRLEHLWGEAPARSVG